MNHSYLRFQEATTMYFVHSDCLPALDLSIQVKNDSERKLYAIAIVESKEFCYAKKVSLIKIFIVFFKLLFPLYLVQTEFLITVCPLHTLFLLTTNDRNNKKKNFRCPYLHYKNL